MENETQTKNDLFKVVSIPIELIQFKNAVGVGLYFYTLGKFKITLLDSSLKRKKTRIDLSVEAFKILTSLIDENENTNNSTHQIQDVIYSVLLWLSKQPAHILQTKL